MDQNTDLAFHHRPVPQRRDGAAAANRTGRHGEIFERQSIPDLPFWILKVRDALDDTYAKYPFLAYGTDWLAFGHFVIALAFVGALRDPVRNRWLYLFGMISCVLVIPFAMIFGGVRGIPVYWRLIDCSFGVFGFVPLWFCWKWTGLER